MVKPMADRVALNHALGGGMFPVEHGKTTWRVDMGSKAVVLLAEGFEEIEALTIIDILRRGGVAVITAGVGGGEIIGAHGVTVRADRLLEAAPRDADAVVLPGGMPGSEHLAAPAVGVLVRAYATAGKIVAAICAAPAVALAPTGVLEGKRVTCYPGFEGSFPASARPSEDAVVEDGQLITSRGPGTAHRFALRLVERLVDAETAAQLRAGMLWDHP
jgi:4-methyl-5(b-hydroxyethyl)-thiazole monophosphate biosynthesis